MAKVTSIDSDIEKIKLAISEISKRHISVFERLAALSKQQERVDDRQIEEDRLFTSSLRKDFLATELSLADLVRACALRIDALYLSFEDMDKPARFGWLGRLFRRGHGSGQNAALSRKTALAARLRETLLACGRLYEAVDAARIANRELQKRCEPAASTFMQRRDDLVRAVDSARQYLKEANANLATTQWRAGNTTDEARSAALLAERDALSLVVENADATYASVRAMHDYIDDALQRFDDFSQQVDDGLVSYNLLFNTLTCEIERAIQLLLALPVALGELPSLVDERHLASLPRLRELLDLHNNHSISLHDIMRRKEGYEEIFENRFIVEKGRVAGRFSSS